MCTNLILKAIYDAWLSVETIKAATFPSLGQMPELVSQADVACQEAP